MNLGMPATNMITRWLVFLAIAALAGIIGRSDIAFGTQARANSNEQLPFDKNRYHPYAHPFPQIIQANDYGTIQAIETLEDTFGPHEFETMSCGTIMHVFTVRDVRVPYVVVGAIPYRSKDTVVLFKTLERVFAGLSRTHSCDGTRGEHHPSRAYRRITTIEFDFGANVLELSSLSNGSDDPERLYVLDVIPRNQSFFWGSF